MTDFYFLAIMAGWEFLFAAVAAIVLLLRIPRWIGLLLAAPFVLMALLMAGLMVLSIWTLSVPPLHEKLVPALAHSAAQKHQAAVLAMLTKSGLDAKISEGILDKRRADDLGIPPEVVKMSTSHISLMPYRLRCDRGNFRAEFLTVEYLFDSHQQLVTWSYYWDYYP